MILGPELVSDVSDWCPSDSCGAGTSLGWIAVSPDLVKVPVCMSRNEWIPESDRFDGERADDPGADSATPLSPLPPIPEIPSRQNCLTRNVLCFTFIHPC